MEKNLYMPIDNLIENVQYGSRYYQFTPKNTGLCIDSYTYGPECCSCFTPLFQTWVPQTCSCFMGRKINAYCHSCWFNRVIKSCPNCSKPYDVKKARLGPCWIVDDYLIFKK